jgi:hypothetical protein
MSGGKGGTQTTEVRLPEAIERASAENLALANEIGRIGFVPYQGPTVAGLSSPQQASMANTNAAANAFGLAQAAPPISPIEQMPGGMGAGYSPFEAYMQAVMAVPQGQRGAIESYMAQQQTGGLPSRPVPEVNISPRSRGKK